MKRGEVHLATFPNVDGSPAKDRPCVIVQADFYNQRIKNVIVVPITTNLTRQNDAAHLFIDVSTPDGQATGLHANSVVSGINVTVMLQSHIRKKIGELSADLLKQVEECLKRALDL